jgi:hypothetical protein
MPQEQDEIVTDNWARHRRSANFMVNGTNGRHAGGISVNERHMLFANPLYLEIVAVRVPDKSLCQQDKQSLQTRLAGATSTRHLHYVLEEYCHKAPSMIHNVDAGLWRAALTRQLENSLLS